MIIGVILLCLISVIATWIAQQLHIPIPGAILGLLALTGICLYRGKSTAKLDRASQALTLLIPLLIMPSSVGIMDHWHLIKTEWLAIMTALSLSALFTLVTTPWLYRKLNSSESAEEKPS